MRPVAALAALLTVLAVCPASAQMRLAISDCGGDADARWTCDTNEGVALTVVASVIAPPLDRLTGQESRLRVRFAEPVPAWWRIETGRCRDAGAISLALTAAATTCEARMGDGGELLGGSFYRVGPDPSTPYGPLDDREALLVVVSAFASPESATPWAPPVGAELGLFTVTIDRRSTVGAGSCEGCSACAWLRLDRVWLIQPVGVGDVYYQDWDFLSSVVAQGMQLGTSGASCPHTPAGSPTWGQVKSLYR